jgi:chromosome segregation ATPase
MVKIINFGDSPIKKIREELDKKDDEIASLKERLKEANHQLGVMSSVNELLKLQILDLLNNLSFFRNQLDAFAENASNLRKKLPTITTEPRGQ